MAASRYSRRTFMSTSGLGSVFRFVTVDAFFGAYRSWQYVTAMKSWNLDAGNRTVRLELANSDGSSSGAQIQFVRANILRFRFAPHKDAAAFTPLNTRSVVMDTIEDLQDSMMEIKPFTVEAAADST